METKELELVEVIEKKINASTEANAKINSDLADQVKALQAKVEEQNGTLITNAEALAALKVARDITQDAKTQLRSAVKQLSENFEGGKLNERIKINTVGEMALANITGTGAQPYNIKLSELVVALPVALQICNVWSTETPIVDASMDGPEGTTTATAEGSAKNMIDFNINGVTYDPQAINSYVTVSRKMMKNLGYLENMIMTRLNKKVMEKLSILALEGNGTSDLLKGAYEFGTAWAAPSAYGSKYATPTLYHVLLIAVAQVRAASYNPSAIVLHPNDAVGLKIAIIEKAINMPEAIVQNGQMFVSGVPIFESANLTADTFLCGDFSLSNIATQGGYELFVDPYTDLKTNKVTILGEIFATHYIAKADVLSMVKGPVAASIAQLHS
jgi:HK97 family phage major capsid protein